MVINSISPRIAGSTTGTSSVSSTSLSLPSPALSSSQVSHCWISKLPLPASIVKVKNRVSLSSSGTVHVNLISTESSLLMDSPTEVVSSVPAPSSNTTVRGFIPICQSALPMFSIITVISTLSPTSGLRGSIVTFLILKSGSISNWTSTLFCSKTPVVGYSLLA